MTEWTKAYLWLSEFWRIEAEKKLPPEQCLECETAVWLRIAGIVVPRIARVAKIEPRTAVDLVKAFQLVPDNPLVGRTFPTTFDIKSDNHVIATVNRCGPLKFFEREAPERISSFCRQADPVIMQRYGESLLPNIKVTPLKLPPRKSKDEVPCIWEYKIEG